MLLLMQVELMTSYWRVDRRIAEPAMAVSLPAHWWKVLHYDIKDKFHSILNPVCIKFKSQNNEILGITIAHFALGIVAHEISKLGV